MLNYFKIKFSISNTTEFPLKWKCGISKYVNYMFWNLKVENTNNRSIYYNKTESLNLFRF